MEFDYSNVPVLRSHGLSLQEAKKCVEQEQVLAQIWCLDLPEEVQDILVYLVKRI